MPGLVWLFLHQSDANVVSGALIGFVAGIIGGGLGLLLQKIFRRRKSDG